MLQFFSRIKANSYIQLTNSSNFTMGMSTCKFVLNKFLETLLSERLKIIGLAIILNNTAISTIFLLAPMKTVRKMQVVRKARKV